MTTTHTEKQHKVWMDLNLGHRITTIKSFPNINYNTILSGLTYQSCTTKGWTSLLEDGEA